jgi:DNA-binding CsgD family transcriptional regulator
MANQKPTRRQLEVLRAYIRTGSVAAAAHELGISETTLRQHLSGLYRRTGCLNAAQAAFRLGAGDLTRVQARADRDVSGGVGGGERGGGPDDRLSGVEARGERSAPILTIDQPLDPIDPQDTVRHTSTYGRRLRAARAAHRGAGAMDPRSQG